MVKSSIQYQLNWERIFKKTLTKGALYPLPSEAAITVVQYQPDFKISCLLPPKERDIKIYYDHIIYNRKIKTPSLLINHTISRTHKYEDNSLEILGDPEPHTEDGKKKLKILEHHPACSCEWCLKLMKYRVKDLFFLFAIDDTKDDSIWAQPYRIGNVYENGMCCFKKSASRLAMPKNLKQAHVNFWMHSFDNDFPIGDIPHTCTRREHRYHHCKKYNTRHECYIRGHHEHPCDKSPPDSEEICNCCAGLCHCINYCDCCQLRCDCVAKAAKLVCNCSCCENRCACRCICDLGVAFADKLSTYSPQADWFNYTKFFFGEKFVSISKKVDAVFVSTNSELLSSIPRKFHYKNYRVEQKFVIGFARYQNNSIEIDLRNGFKFTLDPKQVNILQ